MVETQVRTKKYGSSIGFIIPKEIVDKLDIKPNETILIDIKDNIKQS